MSEKSEVATSESGDLSGREEARAALRPPVNIFEDANGITLEADMPGVSRDRLNVQVDKDTLLVEGDAQIDMPDGMEALYADIRATHYRRSFTLSGELEPDKIEASLRDGVLTVRIPKRAELRPRKIEVRTG
ncbi:MAG: Hsp20/alpha crystallin family protein [Chromatiaceae bacterium]|jgi:HSP20 family protein